MNKEEKTNQLSKSQTTAKEDELTDEEEYVKDWHKKDMISFEDFENIEGILNYVFIRRKKAFEKKTIKKEEIQKISDILRSTLD